PGKLLDEVAGGAAGDLDLAFASADAAHFVVHAAGDVDEDRRGQAIALWDLGCGGQPLIDAPLGAREAFLVSFAGLAPAPTARDRDHRDDGRRGTDLHAAAPFTTPSVSAIRFATAAPECSAPSMKPMKA